MPIGKNSLKRVANNGYSNVKTDAPDMENSVEVKAPTTETAAKKTVTAKPTQKKKTEAKSSVKTAPKAKSEKKPAPKPAEKVPSEKTEIAKSAAPTVKNYLNIGDEMPVWLL